MDNFNLIGGLRDFAISKNWHFLCGDNFYENFEASQAEFENGQLVFVAEFSANPIFGNGNNISSISYAGTIMLGRKFDEDSTPASLDETFIQKYDRRLLSLMQLLAVNIAQFACANELEISNPSFVLAINKFDTNIDFVVGQITLIQ